MKEIKDEGLRLEYSDAGLPRVTWEDCFRALEYVLHKIDENLAGFAGGFLTPTSINLNYPVIGNIDWTSSFWTGMVCLA